MDYKVLAALIHAGGKRVEGGAFEIFIPRHILSGMSPYATIEFNETPEGFSYRFHPNITIEGNPQPEAPTPVEPETPENN